VIVLKHRQITLTHPVLSACAEYGISLFSTGSNHQPNGVFLPFLQHSRATRMQRLQLDLDKPTAKRAWATIVQSKIRNQAQCMKLRNVSDPERFAYSNDIDQTVQQGDQAVQLY
jgi:CRISPR-associated protein Cas1